MINKNKNLISILGLFIIGIIFVIPQITNAQILVPQVNGLTTASIEVVAGSLIQVFLGLLGLIALVIVIYAGFVWMTSGGNEEKISQAKRILSAGVIGLVIIMAAYIITSFILDSVQGALNNSGGGTSQTCTEGVCYGCNRCDGDGNLIYDNTCPNCGGSEAGFDFESTWYSPTGNNVSLCSMIQVKFNAKVDLASVNSDNFKLYECLDYDEINDNCLSVDLNNNLANNSGAQFSLSSSEKVIKFTLGEDYLADTPYVVDLPNNGIKQKDENNYLNTSLSWVFKTGTETDNIPPKVTSVFPSGEEICLNSSIEVEFSEDMDLDSLEDASAFSLYKNLPNDLSDVQFFHNARSDKLIVHPDRNYLINHDYYPLLNGDIIKDTCGNTLSGDGDDDSEGSPIDNYPSNGPSDVWTFKTGESEYCEPQITSITSESYYDDNSPLIIEGHYLSGGTTVIFENNVIVNDTSDICLDNSTYWPDKVCASGSWDDSQISLFIPVIGGDSLGAQAGNSSIKIQTDQGSTTDNFDLLSPKINNISPDTGGSGQYVTLSGINFNDFSEINTSESKIFFRSEEGEFIESDLPCGNDSWKNNQIIITAPENLDTNNSPYLVQVKKVLSSGEEYWSNLAYFYYIDEEAGPGLCSIDVDEVEYNDEFSLDGFKLGDDTVNRKVVLGDDYNPADAPVLVWENPVNGQDTAVTAQTPNLSVANNIGVRVAVEIDGVFKYSNYLNVDIVSTAGNEFQISYISPEEASVGEYVTIYGSGFGNTQGSDKTVRFFNNTAIWPEGDFDFPSACSVVYWQNDKIIVKVPDEFSSLPFSSRLKVINGQLETNEVDIQIDNNDPAPSICSVNPDSGSLGDSLEIVGEYFDGVDKVTFKYGSGSPDDATPSQVDDNLIRVDVPDTQTGLIAAHHPANDYGNTWNFEYIEDTSITDDPEWGFYGWQFFTCERCDSPQVRFQACDPDDGFSPSPAPGNKFVPIDSSIYVEFEYSNGDDAFMDTGSYAGNFNFYICANGNNPLDLEDCNLKAVSAFNGGDTFLEITNLNLDAGYWYALELTDDIVDKERSKLNEYFWYFRVDPYGGVCEPDTLNIEPNNLVKEYVAGDSISYTGLLIDSENCYVCGNSGYSYEWESTDTDLATIDNSTIYNPNAILNNNYNFGSLKIKATSTLDSLELTDDTNLYITADCSVYDNETDCHDSGSCCWDGSSCGSDMGPCDEYCLVYNTEPTCEADDCCWTNKTCYYENNPVCDGSGPNCSVYDNETDCHDSGSCCWDGSSCGSDMGPCDEYCLVYNTEPTCEADDCCWTNKTCYYENNPVCDGGSGSNDYPRVREESCGSSYNSSPSPYPNNENVPVDPIIYVEFQYSDGSSAYMDKASYNNNIKLYQCSSPTNCVTNVNISNITPALNFNVLKFKPNSDLDAGELYKVVLTGDIKDSNDEFLENGTGYEWYFTINNSGDYCQIDTVGIDPTDLTVNFSEVSGQSEVYEASLWDSVNCYNCDDTGYGYAWSEGAGDTAEIITVNGSSNNTTMVDIGQNWDPANSSDINTGIIEAFATNGTDNVRGDTSLTINNDHLEDFNVLSKYPDNGDENICPNTLIKVVFEMPIDNSTLEDNITLIESAITETVTTTYSNYINSNGEGVLEIIPENLLETDSWYDIKINEGSGIKSINGNSLNCLAQGSCEWNFKTANTICELSYVKIVTPDTESFEFNQAGVGQNFVVEGRSLSGDPIVSVEGIYDWQWRWESLNTDLVTLTTNASESTFVVPENDNGTTKVRVTAYPIPAEEICNDYLDSTSCSDNDCCWVDGACSANLETCPSLLSDYENKFGYKSSPLTDEMEVELFMCEDPWTFTDDYFNFKLKYCLDGGLPYLSDTEADGLIINNFGTWSSSGDDSLMREYLFKYIDNSQTRSNNNLNLAQAKSEKSLINEIGLSELTDNRFGFKLIAKMFKDLTWGLLNNTVLAASNANQTVVELPPDIIGLRIYQNKKHFSPQDWYDSSGLVSFKGSPSYISVDNYSALQEGRTVYVNAANKVGSDLYTNVSLISYNQDATEQTLNIFNQLVDNWSFNVNNTLAEKEAVTIDTKRWENLRSMEKKLDSYAQGNKYCAYTVDPVAGFCPDNPINYYHFDMDGDNGIDSAECQDDNYPTIYKNPENGLCPSGSTYDDLDSDGEIDSSECYNISKTVSCSSDDYCQNHEMGFHKCVGVYPELNEGTYLQGVSTSKWPSWTATLGNELGSALPVDPVNEFPIDPDTGLSVCEDPYNPETCWDLEGERFYCPTGSQIYSYQAAYSYNSDERASSFNLYALLNNSLGNWVGINSALNLYNNIDITNSACNDYVSATCGDGNVTLGVEECDPTSTNPIYQTTTLCAGSYNEVEVGCRYDCQWPLQIEPCEFCGDNIVNGPEQCESGQTQTFCANDRNPQIFTCDSDTCLWDPNINTLENCRYCGNGICEDGDDGRPDDGENQITCYADCGNCGNGTCDEDAGEDVYNCAADCTVCGDQIVSGNEECDWAISIGEECTTTVGGIVYDGHFSCMDNASANPCDWSTTCVPDGTCGDGIVNGNELCEPGDIGPQCQTGGYYGNYVCNGSTCMWGACQTTEECGDEIINGNEDCDNGGFNLEFCSDTCSFNCMDNGGNPVGMVAVSYYPTFNNSQSTVSLSTDNNGDVNATVNLPPARVSGNLTMNIEAIASSTSGTITLGVAFVSDRSGSMGTDKMQALKDAIAGPGGALDTLNDNNPNAEIALISYGNTSNWDNGSFEQINGHLNSLKAIVNTYDSDMGGTKHKDTLQFIIDDVFNSANDYDKKILIFMTDGEYLPNSGANSQYAVSEADVLKANGVDIFSVGLTDDNDLIGYMNAISSSACDCGGSACSSLSSVSQGGVLGNNNIDCWNNNNIFEECDGEAGCNNGSGLWIDDDDRRNYHTPDGSGLSIMYNAIAQSISAGGNAQFNNQTVTVSLEEDLGDPGHYFGNIIFPTQCGQGNIVCEENHYNDSVPLSINLGNEFSFEVILSNLEYKFCPWIDSSNWDWIWIYTNLINPPSFN